MDPRFVAAFLFGTALLLTGTALATGPAAAFLSSPVAIALAVVALEVWRQLTPRTPRWIVGVGLAVMGAGLLLALAGAGGAGLATAVAGLGATLCGSQLALVFDPPPRERAPVSRLGARLNAGVAADEALKLYWELLARARRQGDPLLFAREVLEAARRNAERGWIEHPEQAHPVPPTLDKPELVSRSLRGAGPLEHLTFSSEYEPHDPEIHAEYLSVERNRTAHVYLWRHRDGPRPTLVCIHGYGMGRVGFDARAFEIRRIHDALGIDVAAVVLPLHGPRAMFRRSGAGFLDGHPLWTNAAFTQAVWDLRRLCGWLRAEGAPTLGVYGMSLGAMIPVASLSELIWRQLGEGQRRTAEAAGLSQETFEHAWAPHAPLGLEPQVPWPGRLVVAGCADRIVPPAQPQALWEHWGRPAIHWFPGTHTAWTGRAALRDRIESHLCASLLAAPEADAPSLSRFRA
jgi:hypothetical protein